MGRKVEIPLSNTNVLPFETTPALMIASAFIPNTDILVHIQFSIAKQRALACLDTGAQANCISQVLYEALRANIPKYKARPTKVTLVSATGQPLQCDGIINLPIRIGQRTFNESFYIIHNLQQQVILGNPTLLKRQIDLRNSLQCVELKDN